MVKKTGSRQTIIGAVGSVLIGAAILLFVCTMVLNALKTSAKPGPVGWPETDNATAIANRALWNETNATVEQLKTFLTVCSILLGVLGIVLIGSMIIGAIGGGFGG